MPSRLPLLSLLLFCVSLSLHSQVVLNEVVASNLNGLVDEDNEYNDWIELYNNGSQAVNLQGYGLTDDKAISLKWQFPSVSLAPGAFMTVFASDKNRTTKPLSWNTIINKGDTWKYLVPTSDVGSSWKNIGYSDISWGSGPSGFGRGDGDDATVIDSALCVYIRKEFTVTNVAEVKRMLLHLDYDDGFVAYINGQEVARANLGTVGTTIAYNATATDHEALMYQGMNPEVFEINGFAGFLVAGTNVISIEVHNNSATSSDMSLIPFLTIATESANVSSNVASFISVPQNYFHTNFKVSTSGEAVYLFNSTSTLVDSIGKVVLYNDVSYGSKPDGSDLLCYFATPTPGSSNSTLGSTGGPADSVQFSSPGGLHNGGLVLSLTSAVAGDKIYYTTDGSNPSNDDYLFVSAITIDTDTVIRARIYRDGSLPGPIITNTYVKNKTHKFPIVGLSTDPDNLYDYYHGIFELGPNAEDADPYFGANYWQDWEKPFQFELYMPDGSNVINQGVGGKVMGAWSRARDQKSLALFARNDYGKGSFEYAFFKDKSIDKFESIALRNGGNDWFYSFFRDDMVSSLVKGMDLDRQASTPAAVYLNGKYWGVLSLREKINEHFFSSNHHVNSDSIDILTNDGEIVNGSNANYVELINYVKSTNLQSSANLIKVKDMMEIDNYIQYQLTEIYIDNTDWPGNNMKYWRPRSAEGKWRWVIYDTDFGFGLFNSQNYKNNTLTFATASGGTAWPNPDWSTLLFRRLLTSTEFKNNFIIQFCDHLNTTFLPYNVNAKIDSMKILYNGEIQTQIERWPGSCENWSSEVDRIKVFSNNRPTYVWSFLKSYFSLGNKMYVQVNVNDVNMGRVKLNTINLNTASFGGYYYQSIPITLTAYPKPGYKFIRWEGSSIATTPTITYDMSIAPTFKAVFELAVAADRHVVINEVNYKSADTYDTGDWIELYNAGASTVDLSGWILTDNSKEPSYVFDSGTVLYPGDYLVVCDNLEKFKTLHASIKNSTGNFQFGLSSNGDIIRLKDAQGNVVDAVDYLVTNPWPFITTNTGSTIELNNPFNDNSKGVNWKANARYGTPGKANNGLVAVQTNDSLIGNINIFCYPNPVVDAATINVVVKEESNYVVDILDINGRVMTRLLDDVLSSETRTILWGSEVGNVSNLPCGVYYIRCTSKSDIKVIKILKSN